MKHNHPGDCFPGSRDCWLEDNSAAHREHFLLWRKGQVNGNAAGFRVSLPCVFRGRKVHPPVAPDNVKTWFSCDAGRGIVCECETCNSTCQGYSLADRLRVFDSANCWPEVPGVRFNPSIIRFGGEWVFAFRNRQWESEIWVGRLGADLRPIGQAKRLELVDKHCRHGCDDPRFFIHLGALHVAFVGVERNAGGVTCSMGFARLAANLDVETVTFPHYANRNRLEKNWGFFAVDDRLYAVYSIAPHRVLAIVGSETYTSYLTSTKAEWTGGELRGGASPVLVGDRFYSWFHSSVRQGDHLVYNVGVYTFDARPPFSVTSLTRNPLLWAAESEPGLAKYVVFPCGAAIDQAAGGRWVVAGGRDDRLAELWEFDVDQVDKSLIPCRRPIGGEHLSAPLNSAPECLAVSMSIDGWSTEEKMRYIITKHEEYPFRLAVEIGVWRGRVLVLLGQLLQAAAEGGDVVGLAVGIDPYVERNQVVGCVDVDHLRWAAAVDWDAVYAETVGRLAELCPHTAVLLRMTSDQAAKFVRRGIDFLHIDGNHSGEQALRDVETWLPFLSDRGVLILDDVDWEGVRPARQYLAERCEMVYDGRTWQAFQRIT